MIVNGRQNLYCFLFFLVFFIITRQVPFSNYSVISNIAVVILILGLIGSKRNSLINICFISLWLSFLALYSLYLGNNFELIIHFMLAIILLLASNFSNNIPKEILKTFFILIVFQSFFLIIMEIVLNLFYNENSYLLLREAFNDNDWGDLYTYNGYFYRVQLKGNALIPVGFFLTFIREVKDYIKYINFYRVVLFIGICIAGNFAFWISTLFFLIGYSLFFGKNKVIKSIFVLVLIISASGSIFNYVSDVLLRKVDSLGTRGDQYVVLIDGLTRNIYYFIFGNGLGSTLSIRTSFRDYTDNIYFELQSVYYVYQLGILNSIIFFALMVYLALKKIYYKDLLFIYVVYVSYALSNPYFLDTNHIVLIVILRLVYEVRKKNRLYNCSV
ncbi:hypothetical protein N5B96_07890 [Acinetobacter johnsonii]|uniref:hypothetical protein n=1 Tax=Acinetobacter johnsonii TaxID=40214 RepID=UPI002448FEB3|nr:hypothetical protein [Acinetobacter johnsonii]MDH1069410.1 hypothetical protein [Acinetobacter johnsonii]